MISLKSMALGRVLFGLVDRIHFGWQLKHFSITSSIMLVNEGCHLPLSANIDLNCRSCMLPWVMCMFSMYSLFDSAIVVYILCSGDI